MIKLFYFKQFNLLEPHHQIVWCYTQTVVVGVSNPSAEMQSVYSTSPANWTEIVLDALD